MIEADGYFDEISGYAVANRQLLMALDGKTLLVTGAAGLIGAYLTDMSKLSTLGWSAVHPLETGIPRTVAYLRQCWR